MKAREVVFVDGVRTPFGKSGPKGIYAETRADDLVVRVIRELLRRNPDLPGDRVGEVAIAATTQIGDQGLTIGRSAAILAGLPVTVPGYAIDRMCAGAMTAVTTTAGAVALGTADIAIAGGVEHMGRHPMGEQADPNPRFLSEKLVDESALFMGMTAENLHDRFPAITKERADAYALASQRKVAAAYAAGKIQPDLVPMAVRTSGTRLGLGHAWTSRPGRRPPSRAWRRSRPRSARTAGSPRATQPASTTAPPAASSPPRRSRASSACTAKMRLVDFSFAGVEPEVMGIGPVPATEKLLARQEPHHGRHRPDRDQRGVRRPGAGLPRPLQDRRRRPAGEPVGRRDRARPPARLLRRAADDPAGPPVRRAPRGPLRPDHDVRRHGHGRHRAVGADLMPMPDERNVRPARDSHGDVRYLPSIRAWRRPSPTRW